MVKICRKCEIEKQLIEFHLCKNMKDGRYNVCKKCHYEYGKQYRIKNPNTRKKEYDKKAKKEGSMKWDEYMKVRSENKVGRNITANFYSHKRRLQKQRYIFTELDMFVFAEASRLRDQRYIYTNIKWHLDHIVPINHKNACGFHNAYNIQVVPETWNVKKKNLNMDRFSYLHF